ncbi:MAG TPA: Zn-dependent alcohol dehydrogenase [Acidimicrobiales bacterium]|jgi:S-(hydroxymethyl)glutathione dehydrogenase/alcohol dehydrogenase
MRGIVYLGDRAEVTDELEVRAPGPGDVIVRLVAAGVCHSDISVINGTIPWPVPAVLGHEGAGIVEAVGSSVTRVKPGDHVVVATVANCGMCKWCNTGRPTLCRSSIGNATQPFTYKGQPATNFAGTSSFAERTVIKEIQAVPISDAVPLTSAALLACGVVTGVGAVLNRAKVQAGQSAAVFGVGGVGLNCIQALALSDASRIIAIDTLAGKESLARQFGATDFIDASQTDTVAAVNELLPGSGVFGEGGVDWSFECVGHPAVLRTAIDILDWGGTCVAVGVPAPGIELSIPITHILHVERGLIGCRAGSVRPQYDIPLYADLYLEGKLKLDELVTQTYPLEDFHTVTEDMHAGKLARGVLTF